jgi:hypothetical protein
MSTDTTLQTLQDLVARETRSVLHYAGDAYPWTTSEHKGALEQLQALIHEEREAVAAISRYVFRHRVMPTVGGYPVSFTTLNFLSLDALVARLLDYERRSLEQVRADLKHVTDPEARRLVEALAALKEKNVAALARMGAPDPMVKA